MSRRARLVVGLAALAGLAALLVRGVAGLPDYGHPRGPYADLAPKLMLNERQVTNAVTGVTFDLRGFDTLGEELILFVAALGAAVLIAFQLTVSHWFYLYIPWFLALLVIPLAAGVARPRDRASGSARPSQPALGR